MFYEAKYVEELTLSFEQTTCESQPFHVADGEQAGRGLVICPRSHTQ